MSHHTALFSGETLYDRGRQASRWRWRLGARRPLEARYAASLWEEHLRAHDGDEAAALGELVGAVLEAGLLPERPRW